MSAPLTILFQDDILIAIDKPAGMLVHRTKLDAYATNYAMQTLRDQVGERVWPIHRLDKPTSGVLVFGRSKDAARQLSTIFEERRVEKVYRAVARGWTDPEGTIDYPLQEILDKTTDRKARQDKPAQEAVSHYKTLARCEVETAVGRYATARYSLVEIRPETGRKNQIRRHFKHIFHPILGDRKFGDRAHNAFLRDTLGVERMLLAATSLSFEHPITGDILQIEAQTGFPLAISSLFQGPSGVQSGVDSSESSSSGSS